MPHATTTTASHGDYRSVVAEMGYAQTNVLISLWCQHDRGSSHGLWASLSYWSDTVSRPVRPLVARVLSRADC